MTATVTDASKLLEADAIILCYSSDEADLRTVLSNAGITDDQLPPMFTTYATTTSRGIPGFPMLQTDGLEMMAEELGFVYSDVINPVYALAYYNTQFYHVKSDTTTLSNVLSYNIENMSLPAGVTSDLSGYSDSIIQGYIDAGIQYYADNKAAIDAASPKLTTTKNLTLPDTTTAAADKTAANAVTQSIGKLSSSSTSDAIAQARAAYDELTADQKALVPAETLSKLTSLESDKKYTADINAAGSVAASITKLGDNPSAEAIKAARAAYEALTTEQQNMISGKVLANLITAEKLQAKAEADEKAAAEKAEADAKTAAEAEAAALAKAQNVPTVKVASAKAGKGKITVKLSAASGVTGYEIAYKVKGSKKWKTVKATSASKVIKKLKKGKKYQVKVRAFNTYKGQTYTGKWSSVKTSSKVK